MILINLSQNNNLDSEINMFKNYVYNEKNIKSCETYKKTLHVFEHDLPNNLKKAFSKIKNSQKMKEKINEIYPEHDIIHANEMNELYVSCVSSEGSDNVFITRHVDGPYYLFPGCTLLRALFVIDGNKNVFTIFPEDGKEVSLSKGDFLAFDFNRDIHFIEKRKLTNDNNIRIVLKVHYAVVPKYARSAIGDVCKISNENYNFLARQGFNKAKTPKTVIEKCLSGLINSFTISYTVFLENISWENLFLIMIWVTFMRNDFKQGNIYFCHIFFFIYYFAWTFRTVKLDHFIRDAKLYKNIAWGIILKLYFEENIDVSSLVVSGLGIFMAFSSYRALGEKVTYFQKELTNKDTKLVLDKFPYNLGIKSPMIIGNLIFLGGLLINKGFRDKNKYLVGFQILGYIIQMYLEDNEIYFKDSDDKYNKVKKEFDKYHTKRGNIGVHLITTVVGFISFIALIKKFNEYNGFDKSSSEVLILFILTLFHFLYKYTIPDHQKFINTIVLVLAYFIPTTFPNLRYDLLLVLSVVIQELSHYIFNEKTYMSTYNNPKKLLLHNLWLVPLVLNKCIG